MHVIPARHDGHKSREDDDVANGGRHFPVGKRVPVKSGKSGRAKEVDHLVDPIERDVVQRHGDQLYRVVQLNFTTEISVFPMMFENALSIFSMASLTSGVTSSWTSL